MKNGEFLIQFQKKRYIMINGDLFDAILLKDQKRAVPHLVESSQEPQIATPAETPTESGDGSTTPVGESSNQEKTEATYSFVDDEELLKKLV